MEIIIEFCILFIAAILIPVSAVTFLLGVYKGHTKLLKYACILFVVSVALFVRMNYAEFWIIDRCMDSGGAYSKTDSVCMFSENT